jgi:hypothetical protein
VNENKITQCSPGPSSPYSLPSFLFPTQLPPAVSADLVGKIY